MIGCLSFIGILVAISLIIAAIESHKYAQYFRKLCVGMNGFYELQELKGSKIEYFKATFQDRSLILKFGRPEEYIAITTPPLPRPYWERKSKKKFKPEKYGVSEVLEIRLPLTQKFWLRMYRELLAEEDEDEINSGIEWLDRQYLIHTDQREAAEDFLRRPTIRKCLLEFPCSFDKLEIIRGDLYLNLYDPRLWKMDSATLNAVLNDLLIIVNAYEDHNLITIGIAMAKSLSRCPYCRSPFDENSGPIIQCQNCSTHLHETCWKENGQCTTWGCRPAMTG